MKRLLLSLTAGVCVAAGCTSTKEAEAPQKQDEGFAKLLGKDSPVAAAPAPEPVDDGDLHLDPVEALNGTAGEITEAEPPGDVMEERKTVVDFAKQEGLLGSRGAGRGGGATGVGLGESPLSYVAPPPPPGRPRRFKARLRVADAVYPEAEGNTESYKDYGINAFVDPGEDALSTFAVDVDTGSYTVARRKILEGSLPPPAAVRVEEFLNYFRYDYRPPSSGSLAVHLDAAPSPFTEKRTLLRVGVQGKRLSISERQPAHLTFLVDVSGSMQSPDKLPLVQRSLRILVDNLRDGDSVALVTYAGSTRVVLPPTGLEEKAAIHAAIARLSAGGSTAMGSGIELAYREAMKRAGPNATSRVIILSDGDANVGPTTHEAILRLIAGYVKEGITLTTVGFGMGNYKDDLMEQLANKGNGSYFYVDSLMQARRVFQEQLGGTLEVIARDVKVQVEFDPAQVRRYRLVGYENRDVADHDFRNDKVDAGEIGSGHTVTALYELELREGAGKGLCTVRVRAKPPKGSRAEEAVFRFKARDLAPSFEEAHPDLRFAVAVMGAAEKLRQSPHARTWSLSRITQIARGATPEGNAEREEFLSLLGKMEGVFQRVAAR